MEILKKQSFQAIQGMVYRARVLLDDGRRIQLESKNEDLTDEQWLERAADYPEPEPDPVPTREVPEGTVSAQTLDELVRVKRKAIEFIKSNPGCTIDDVYAQDDSNLLEAGGLMEAYMNSAVETGRIPAPVWDYFKQLVILTDTEVLMDMK